MLTKCFPVSVRPSALCETIESVSADLPSLLRWLNEAAADPVAAKLVPGASETERRRLAALGAVVRDLVPTNDRIRWPSDIVDWLESSPVAPADVASAARRALEKNPDQSLAALYEQTVSRANRRVLGTFFTPSAEVQLMLDMWERSEQAPATVIDVGAGVGVFTASAAARWPKARVFGVDINPVTLGLLALRIWFGALPVTEESNSGPGICLIRDDFTTWISESLHSTPMPRLILGNPPYTRWQLLSNEDRVRLTSAGRGLCGSRASLSALMTAISIRHLDRSDGLCLLLPAQWLESEYAKPLRDHLAGLKRRRIELRLVESKLFPDAQVDAVALLVGHEQEDTQTFSAATWTTEDATPIDRDQLIGAQWRALFNSPSRKTASRTAAPKHAAPVTRLSSFCVIRRGTATGANRFFVLNDREIAEHRLPQERLLKLVRRLHGLPEVIDQNVFDSASPIDKRWLLHVELINRREDVAIEQYLTAGERAGIPAAHLCKVRRGDWYDLTHDLTVPDVIVGPMTRGRIRFVENRVRAVIINNLYGWRWRQEVPPTVRTAILAWLRSESGQASVIASARQQGAGLHKIEPTALANVIVPGGDAWNIQLSTNTS